MRARLEQRLRELREEYHQGEALLQEYDRKQRELKDTLLRIGGAIQVLEEELDHANTRLPGQALPAGGRGDDGEL